jgi:hypothetical protein
LPDQLVVRGVLPAAGRSSRGTLWYAAPIIEAARAQAGPWSTSFARGLVLGLQLAEAEHAVALTNERHLDGTFAQMVPDGDEGAHELPGDGPGDRGAGLGRDEEGLLLGEPVLTTGGRRAARSCSARSMELGEGEMPAGHQLLDDMPDVAGPAVAEAPPQLQVLDAGLAVREGHPNGQALEDHDPSAGPASTGSATGAAGAALGVVLGPCLGGLATRSRASCNRSSGVAASSILSESATRRSWQSAILVPASTSRTSGGRWPMRLAACEQRREPRMKCLKICRQSVPSRRCRQLPCSQSHGSDRGSNPSYVQPRL